ncbi:response regulator [Aquabacterium sp. OR-4]|uniref:response regulator n=1 Tax=Aquabacterium sp. OR-4 TaxID=2978127 RepID=UPI0021B4AB38|nr:response regulator transcription factor [Aquabacterium sp. OR-4]MDT7837181.1 response regulator transcription factor [Aquabacterium sp. OR-4]
MITVMLLDDHAVVRAGYRRWIDDQPDLKVVAEAATSAQACELLRQQPVDVAVVDLMLKDDSGLEAIRRLRSRSPGIRVLVFTMHSHEGYALQALRSGAMGYLTKDSSPDEMLHALREVAAGRRVFAAEVVQAWLADGQALPAGPLARLTPREFEVLRMATDGLSTAAIARALHLSEKTIHNTMSLVRQKLGAHSDFSLMRLVTEQGLFLT